ncbi:evolutionarily conserved signaling intermediate in Toll pathway, mitochondrial [Thamnophis elegans]|uniref:evolutionarily conserved signaling intermediate in Toll pathway, mitochondrial n=1 Tax=Thamnophis elegans TaxID=35005 RepID=UPI001378E979|nr:evolutionarily conserved signaling intermediate in Toll pathway, mitochondrial [Thamnophis elegans]XP_032067442.1 evolutionarily conserved signaling intermediate in Toll pathway, mitochondrial [Thamnophis elegans]XP_032067443.1 evolutionarily conserved signaling intermediate in Toll pathway, mitochondrial [Thamnophis elegans]
MKCLRALLVAGQLSARRSSFPKKNLIQSQRSSYFQNSSLVPVRSIQRSTVLSTSDFAVKKHEKPHKESANQSLVKIEDIFETVSEHEKTAATFQEAVDIFCKQDIRRTGHVEFIYAALKKMPEFGVEKDVDVYNKILDVFPKKVFIPQNVFQKMLKHYPRQQDCAVVLLEQMEHFGVMPNLETRFLLLEIFGNKSYPVRKYQRIMYWFPKFKHINPYPVPTPLPEDPIELAKLSLQRIAADLDSKVTVYQTSHSEVLDSGKEINHPHIVGTQSPDQQSLLASHNTEKPIFLEGPFRLWLKAKCVYYYVLRAKLSEEHMVEVIDPERNFYYPMHLDLDLERDVLDDYEFYTDKVKEGPVFAMCMVGAEDKATLAKWIVGLQETNPILHDITVIFRLTHSPQELQCNQETEGESAGTQAKFKQEV